MGHDDWYHEPEPSRSDWASTVAWIALLLFLAFVCFLCIGRNT